ncbi:MAG: hypothetical protein LBM98_01145 [Oscillospiraceae bacterium]|jgi:hypothetical protein|nr:hypothetical protein [Oscillospiraceae bacterium]
MTTSTGINDLTLRQIGELDLEVLIDELGVMNGVKLYQAIHPGCGDYTRDRQLRFDTPTDLDSYVRMNQKWLDEGISQLKEGKVHTITLSEDD